MASTKIVPTGEYYSVITVSKIRILQLMHPDTRNVKTWLFPDASRKVKLNVTTFYPLVV